MKTITNRKRVDDFTEKLETWSKTQKNVLSSQKKFFWSIVTYSVEKSSKMGSRFLRKNKHFFRQINTKMNHLPIHYKNPSGRMQIVIFRANLRHIFQSISVEAVLIYILVDKNLIWMDSFKTYKHLKMT